MASRSLVSGVSPAVGASQNVQRLPSAARLWRRVGVEVSRSALISSRVARAREQHIRRYDSALRGRRW